MTKEEIEQELADALGYSVTYKGKTVHGSVPKVAKKLQTEMKHETFYVDGVSYGIVRDAVCRIGEIVEDKESNSEMIARVKSGFGDMNPALLVIVVSGSAVTVCAYAKEGLIKQHTAEKAIQMLKDQFR